MDYVGRGGEFHHIPQSFPETVGSLPQKGDISTVPSTVVLSSNII